jgi:ABC-type transport system substrate-binding protein
MRMSGRRKMRKRAVFVVLALTTVFALLVGCGTPAPAPTPVPPTPEVIILTPTPVPEEPPVTGPQRGGTLRVAETSDLYFVDAHKVTGEIRNMSAYAEGLTSITPEGEIVGGLAESWDVSEDGTVYTFYLREGVKFHNGDNLTADHVKWNLDRVMDPTTEALRFADMEPVESVEVVDESTVEITLEAPYAGFAALLIDTFIMHPDSPQEEGVITQPIGTAPFEFVEWIPDQHLKMKAFADYWQPGIPYVDELIMLPIVDQAARFTALQTGEVDVIWGYPRDQVVQAAMNPEFEATGETASRQWMVTFNHVNPPEPIGDPRVRQAIGLALNKAEINNLYELGLGVVNNQWYAPGEFWYDERLDDPYAEPKIDEAKALLADAGYPNGFDVTLIAPNAFDIDRLVTIIADQISRIGIRGNVEIADWSAYEARLSGGGDDWGISAMGFSPKADPVIYWNIFRAGSPGSVYVGAGTDDADMLGYVDQASAISDPQERKDLYLEAYKVVQDKALYLFMLNDFTFLGHRTNVMDWKPGNGFYNQFGGGLSNAWLEPQ